MPTLVRNEPQSHHVRKNLYMESPAESGHTHSLSQTSNKEEVSWSSSDGSTYYSEDEVSLKQREQTRPVSSQKQQDSATSYSEDEESYYSEDEESLKQREQTSPAFSQKQQDNKVSYSLSADDFKTKYQPSKARIDETLNFKEFQPEKAMKRPPAIAPKKRKKLVLKDVESFPAINIATGSEDGVSEVAFLTTEDTAEVFCTGGVPFEVTANKKLYEKMSGISSASSYESSSDSSDSESDEESQKQQEKHGKWTPNTSERATIESQKSVLKDDDENTSVSTMNEHSVQLVSVSYQDPVSSLECTSSLDDSSLDSNTSKDQASTHDKPRLHEASKSPVHARQALTSTQIESKVKRINEIKRKKSDMKTDERIRQLKAKIKSIQDLSTTNMTASSTEVESHITPSFQPQRLHAQKKVGHDDTLNDDNAKPIANRFESRDQRQRDKSGPSKTMVRQSFEADKSLVGTIIPVLEREEVSTLRFDTSARDMREYDIETGQKRPSLMREKRDSITEHTKVLIGTTKVKLMTAYEHSLLILERKRADFLRKPKYEQILIIAIGSLFFLFLILLFVMISQ